MFQGVYHDFLSVYCSFVVTCWEMVERLALLYVMFSCCFFPFVFSFGGLVQVWYLIVSISDLCTLTYFLFNNIALTQYRIDTKVSTKALIRNR